MTIMSNKGIPSRPFDQTRFCTNCSVQLVRKWKGKHIALCTADELKEALASFGEREQRLDPSAAYEIGEMLIAMGEMPIPHSWYRPNETTVFTITEGYILYTYQNMNSFVAKKDLPKNSTLLFVEHKPGDDYKYGNGKLRWFTDKSITHPTCPWVVVGKLELR